MLAVLVETPLNSFLWLASIVLLLHSASDLEKKKDNEFPILPRRWNSRSWLDGSFQPGSNQGDDRTLDSDNEEAGIVEV